MRLPLELDITLEERIDQVKELGQDICDKMLASISELGIKKEIDIKFGDADFRLEKDPYSGTFSLEGKWHERQQTKGSIIFHDDGTFFAEYDVIEDHPTKAIWFIEAVTAWGRDDNIKVELRLIEKV